MKIRKRQTALVVLVFIAMTIATLCQACRVYKQDIATMHDRAKLSAQNSAEELSSDFEKGIAITETLKALVISNNGMFDNFETVSVELMQDYISSIQIAPGGVVTDIYPSEGNEAGKIDLLQDEKRGPILQYSIDNNVPAMQGPFELNQGGKGIAIRNPVFLVDDNGEKTFWGFTIVIIKVPYIFDMTLSRISDYNYDYCLDTTTSPLSKESARVTASVDDDSTLKDPVNVSFESGECQWTINVEPRDGWVSQRTPGVLMGGAVVTVLFTLMTYLLLSLKEQKQKLHDLASRDVLTGLLSRRGFMDEVKTLISKKSTEIMTLVFIDLDDFKQINDVHGHMIGDEALKNLANNLENSFPKDSIIGRTGGDEFCVVITGKNADETETLIHDAVAKDQSFQIDGQTYTYTISAGYADYPSQAKDRKDLMTHADQALYAAKLGGKHRCAHYEPIMSDIKRTNLGFSVKGIAEGIPGAFLIYKADETEEILFANDELINLVGCTNFDEFLTYTKSSFKNLVHPDDVERVEDTIWKQINSQKDATDNRMKSYDDFVEYKIETKSGSVKDVVDLGRFVKTESNGELFFVFIKEKASEGNGLMDFLSMQ